MEEGKAITKEQTLDELTARLTKSQKDYLYLRLLSVDISEAIRIANIKKSTHYVWRADDEFRQIEEFILTKRDIYAQEAFSSFIKGLGAKAQKVIESLIEMGLDWEGVKQGDKAYIMRAVELVAKLQPERGNGNSYDELILRRKRG